jgi:hypothetical protein
MKLMKIYGKFYKPGTLSSIVPRSKEGFVLHFTDGETVLLSPEAFEEVKKFVGAEFLDMDFLSNPARAVSGGG